MKYIRLQTTNPYLNLAIEEYLFNTADDSVFMLWQNEPTVVIGKSQNAYAEVELSYAKENGIHVCRRITGGGAVYHDFGNVNYTFIAPRSDAEVLDYAYFTKPIINALAKFGLRAELSGRNDILCEGKKFSGNAQHASSEKILHHGTLLFNTDTGVLSSVLRTDKEKLEFNAVKSHKSRVVNLKTLLGGDMTAKDFMDALESEILKNAERAAAPTAKDIEILRSRNESDEWIYGDKRYLTNYSVTRRKKYPFGIVSVNMQLDGDIIESIVISGDFFGIAPVTELEKMLVGQNINAINYVDPSPYINKMTFHEIVELIQNQN